MIKYLCDVPIFMCSGWISMYMYNGSGFMCIGNFVGYTINLSKILNLN